MEVIYTDELPTGKVSVEWERGDIENFEYEAPIIEIIKRTEKKASEIKRITIGR